MKRLLIILFIPIISLYSREALSEDSEYLDVYFEKIEDGGYNFYADNRHFIPQYLSLGFTSLTNLKMDRDNPSQITLKPGEERVLLFTLTTVKKNSSYSFKSRLTYTNGDPLTVEPDGYNYSLPFEHGSKLKLDQGFGGKFSHQDENFYALDFSMDVGTPIYAAREGVVIEVKEDSNRGGPSKAFAKYGNFISIYHKDGTFASYVHLKKNGSDVEVGDVVKEGELIGYSGNTGLTTGPHLHFSVNVPSTSGIRQSIPIKVLGVNGEGITPVVGEYYYANHRGKESFSVIYGSDIKNSDFDDYNIDVEHSDKLSLRDESVDNTTIIYCQNGYNSEVKGKFTFSLNNSFTSRATPIEIIIPPLKEVFVCLVRPKDSKKPFAFSYSISYRVAE